MTPDWKTCNLHVQGPKLGDTLLHKGEVTEYAIDGDEITFMTAVHGSFTFNADNSREQRTNQYRADDGSIAILLPPSSV